jgi:hypothetical protein
MKRVILITSIVALVFAFGACSKEKQEAKPAAQSQVKRGPIIDTPPAGHGGTSAQRTQMKIVVPPEVEQVWKSVTIVVEDKQQKKDTEFNVKLGDEFNIPDSTLRVKVGPFLPDFKMSGSVITSATNEPNNPSVGIAIFDGDKKVFPPSGEWGWLYAKFPNIHNFQHERFGLKLKAGTRQEQTDSKG